MLSLVTDISVLSCSDIGPDAVRQRLMQDMDAWGYSFSHGTTGRWFPEDADDARACLIENGVLYEAGEPVFTLRRL